MAQFRDRTLGSQDFPHVFLDATYCKARVGHRIVSQAIVVAVGIAADGRREVLGFDVGDSENEGFWTSFLRSLKVRGLDGVKLVMSDAYTKLKKAIRTVFQSAGWQRCRVHFMRNVLAMVPKGSQDVVAAMLTDAEADLLAFAAFPRRHWRQIWSTNPLERVNKEIKHRTMLSACSPTRQLCYALPARS